MADVLQIEAACATRAPADRCPLVADDAGSVGATAQPGGDAFARVLRWLASNPSGELVHERDALASARVLCALARYELLVNGDWDAAVRCVRTGGAIQHAAEIDPASVSSALDRKLYARVCVCVCARAEARS